MNGGECTFGSQGRAGAGTAGPEGAGGRGPGLMGLRKGLAAGFGRLRKRPGSKGEVFGNGVLLVHGKALEEI